MFDAVESAGAGGCASTGGSWAHGTSDRDLQRAAGAARVVVSGSERGTRIVDIFQKSPLRLLFPRIAGSAIEEAVVVNTAGGMAGGDRLELAVTALADASITVTSQAAERVYRALNEPTQVATRLKAHAGARLAWLPQETILFNQSRLQRTTEIEVFSGSELLALEWLTLGRTAHGEEMLGGRITDGWRVVKDGRLIWADALQVTGDAFPHLRNRALLSDYRTIGTVIYFGPDVDAKLQFMREQASSLSCECAATVINGLLVTRFAAHFSADVKCGLRELLRRFGGTQLSRSLQTPKMWSA